VADEILSVWIDVSEPGADEERRDVLAHDLAAGLRDAVDGEVAAPPPGGPAVPGTRGTLETIGAVLVTVQASVELLRAVHGAIRDWRDRTPAARATATLRLQRGDATIEIAGLPPEKQEELLTGILGIIDGDTDGRT
jgi:hypothetical protein